MGDGAGLGLPPMLAVVVAPAGSEATAFAMPPSGQDCHLLLELRLEQGFGGPGDELPPGAPRNPACNSAARASRIGMLSGVLCVA